MQKGLASLLIILLITVAVGGYLVYQKQTKLVVSQPVVQSSPSPTASPIASGSAETANWKTYTKDKLWTVKYPSSWYVIQESDDGIVGVAFADSEQINNANSGNISVRVTWAEKNNSYDSRISQVVGKVDSTGGNTYTILKKLNIDGSQVF